MMPLYIDNDVVSKLASCDLVDTAIAVLRSHSSAVRILSTFKHRFGITNEKRRAKIQQQIGDDAFDRIVVFQRSVSELDAIADSLVLVFEDLPAIHAGEALLFAAASEVHNALVVTGDKPSLRCLGSAEQCKNISLKLAGRVLCFEQLIKEIIKTQGFDQVKRKVVPAVDCATALRAAFGMGLDAEEAQVLRVLDAYIAELRDATGSLLR